MSVPLFVIRIRKVKITSYFLFLTSYFYSLIPQLNSSGR